MNLLNKEIQYLLMLVKCFIVNRKVSKYLPQFIGEHSINIINYHTSINKNKLPKIIWMYWEDKEVPKYIQKIVDNTKALNIDFQLNLLNKNNIKAFLPDFCIEGDMPIANKTDILRLKLIYEFGGVWIDSTTIFYENLDWVIDAFENAEYDLVGYYKETSTNNINYPIIESWFLAAKAKNLFIKKWLEELEPLGEMGNAAYFDMIKKRNDYLEIKQKIARPEYLLVYLAQQIALRSYNDFNVYLRRSEDSAFLIQESRGWANYEINYAICRLPLNKPLIPIVKLTSGDRILINSFIKYNLVKKNSVIGSMINGKTNII